MKRQMSGDYQDDFEDDAKILIIRMMVKMMVMTTYQKSRQSPEEG